MSPDSFGGERNVSRDLDRDGTFEVPPKIRRPEEKKDPSGAPGTQEISASAREHVRGLFDPIENTIPEKKEYHRMHYTEITESVDGTEYVRNAFGGFGPNSPEYDHGRRLEIIVPDVKASVRWFNDTEIEPGHTFAVNKFSAAVSDTSHPGVRLLGVEFVKTQDTSLISARIEPHFGSFTVEDAPKRTKEGLEINTYAPAEKMFTDHMRDRLEELYPDRISTNKSGNTIEVELDDDLRLFIGNGSYFMVTVNGDRKVRARYSVAKPTPRQLECELNVIRDHFPAIAEAYADFFRKQLPKTQIEVSYKSAHDDSQESDPVNPQRMAQLRQELIVEPREDDFKYIGGLDADIEKLKEAAMGFTHPEAFREFGVAPPRGILLQGPPGTGKTSLAMAFARDSEAIVLQVKASTIKSAYHGETERNIRGVFQLADELVDEGERVVIFIDEIEAIAPARDSMGSSNIDKNVTTELLQGMNVDRKNCVIIAATNVPGMVDPALTNNSSRFSQQLEIGFPDTDARTDIIEKLFLKFTDKSKSGSHETLFDPSISIDSLARGSEGLTGADIEKAIRLVLFTKAVLLASTGEKPGPATNGELYQSIKNVALDKDKTNLNYLDQ